jgi:hypothetical protein
MPRRETQSDPQDDQAGKPADARCQSWDGSLVFVYRVPLSGETASDTALLVRLDVEGEVFLSLSGSRLTDAV